MKDKWKRLNKISAWAKKHTFLATCAFAILVCLLICISFVVNFLCSTVIQVEIGGLTAAEFSDDNFELAVRQYLSRPEGDLYIEDMYSMKTLSLSAHPLLTNLADLTFFPNLTTLTISNCAVYDVTPVGKLQYLETLNLPRNRITDITPLYSLERLKVLDLSYNNISKVTEEIGSLEMLTDLSLDDNRIRDINPLLGNENLVMLNLRNNRLSKLPDMSSLKSLVRADFGLNALTEIAPISNMRSIQTFIVDGNLLDSIDFLRDQLTLIEVDLSKNDISDISALTTCPNLESLTFYGVQRFDLTPLEQLPKFNSLFLDDNFERVGRIDFLFGQFKTGDMATVVYIVSRNNLIEEY